MEKKRKALREWKRRGGGGEEYRREKNTESCVKQRGGRKMTDGRGELER